MTINETAAFYVTLNLTVSTDVLFSDGPRDSSITHADAIDNAVGCLDEAIAILEGEGFYVHRPITGNADEQHREVFSIGTPTKEPR